MTWSTAYSSVDSSAPSILPPRVRVPSTPFTLLLIYIDLCCVEKDKNKQNVAMIGASKKYLLDCYGWIGSQ